jgi:hypothetical protein
VSFPIICIDFLRHHGLLVDVANLHLLPGELPAAAVCAIADSAGQAARPRSYAEAVKGPTPSPSGSPTPPSGSSPLSFGISSLAVPILPPDSDWAAALRFRFPAVFNPGSAVSLDHPPHGVQHLITTNGQPPTAKFRRLDPARLAAAKAEFQAMLDEGIIRRSNSQWSSPLHMVKKDSSWRPCGDYRRLNLQTAEDKYPLPNMAGLVARLARCTIFSKLNHKKGYLQVPVAAGVVPKTAIITPFELLEFVRMPFGLKNTGMTFQRLMDSILGGLPFAFVYLDDILVASSSLAENRRHLCQVFSILQRSGLIVNSEKCIFGHDTEFLGHRISSAGTSLLPSQVSAIADFPRPTTVRQLQAFLGLFNFYRKFILAASRLILPFTRVLRGNPRGDHPLAWSAEMGTAFTAARQSLLSSATLEHPAGNAELSLVTDASSSHVGAVIQQKRPGQGWRLLGFFPAQLDKAQGNYSAFDRELFAVVAAIKHFRYMLEGWPFTVFTDHKPLWGPSAYSQTPGQAGSSGICSSPNSHPPFVTSPANPMWWRTPSPGQPAMLSRRPPSHQSDVQRSFPSGGIRVVAKDRTEVKAPSGSSVHTFATSLTQAAAVAASSPVSTLPVDLVALVAAQLSCGDCQQAASSSALRVTTIKMDNTHRWASLTQNLTV